MRMEPWEEPLIKALAELTETSACDWFLTYRCRHGMLTALKAIRDVAGEGKVLTQLFTCCTAVDPILMAGFEPVYGDISSDTCSLDPNLLRLGSSVRAVVLQHTFGIVDEESSRKVAAKARGAGALVLEDCAHCVGRMARDDDGLPLADVSFHSFGVEKMLPTFFGGAVWVNPASEAGDVMRAIRAALSSLPAPDAHHEWLNSSYRGVNRILVHLPAALSVPFRRMLTALDAFDPAVSEEERLGAISREPMRATRFACEAAFAAIDDYAAAAERRRLVVEVYRGLILGIASVEVPGAVMAGEAQPLLRFPVILASEELADAAEHSITNRGYYTTSWYRPELGPGVLDPAVYKVPDDRKGLCANDWVTAGVVNLPTDIPADAAPHVVSAVLSVLSSPSV